MTVPVQTPIVDYTASGVGTVFTVPFRIIDESDLVVTLAGSVVTTGFTLSGLGEDQAEITFDTPPPLGTGIIMYRQVALERDTDYQENGDFRSPTVNADFDRLWQAMQDQGAANDRSLRYPVAEYDRDGTLPPAASRSLTLLGFDVNGNPTAMPVTASVGAGDMSEDIFEAGVDFVPGTTQSITLSRIYTSVSNLFINFDGTYQNKNQIESLVGTTLTFTAPIPVGVAEISVKGGTTLSIFAPAVGSVTDDRVAGGSKLASRLGDFVSLSDFGCVYDGTDETAKVLNAIATIGTQAVSLMVPKPVVFSQNLTFGSRTVLDFRQGGMLIGTAGTELVQVQRQIMSGPRQIFDNCVVKATTGMLCGPEWFGAAKDGVTPDQAAFNAALELMSNVGGILQMQPGDYGLSGPINNFFSHIAFRGVGQNLTRLVTLATNIDGIDCIGSPGALINNPVFEGFNLICKTPSVTGTGINLQYTTLAKASDIQVADFITGYFMQGATNTFWNRCGASYSGATNGFNGWLISGNGNIGGNASSSWRDTYVDGSASSGTGKIAYHANGAYVSDLYFSNASSAGNNYGYSLDYSTATAGGYADVIIHNPVIDAYTLQGILVNQLPRLQKLTVIGGWINPNGTGAETDGVYVINSAGQVRVIGTQFDAENNYANAVGVRVINSLQTRVSGCAFTNHKYGIDESGSAICAYVGNDFYNDQAKPATAHVNLIGSSRSQVTGGNTFDGYAVNCVTADATSTGVGVTCNTFNASTLGAPRVSNLSSGPVGGSDGSIGLNSGV